MAPQREHATAMFKRLLTMTCDKNGNTVLIEKPMPQRRPVLAAALIARDEARCIRRCLDSIAPWVDRMVVLDTGSTDDTPAIARNAGAEVQHMTWPDSFAVARNQALALADADFNLVLDADEWLNSGGEHLRAWCAGPPRLGRVCIHSDAEGASTTRNWITRVLPRGARYKGRVHEQVASDLPRARIDLHLGHDGYLDAQITGKHGRNHALLLGDLSERPNDPYLLYQLGKDADMRADRADACTHYAQALAVTSADANWRHELVVCALQALSRAGRLQDALDLADAELGNWAQSPDFFFVLGDVLLEQAIADPRQAIGKWLPLASGAWERCLAIGERPALEGSVAGRGSHLAAHNLGVVRSQLAVLG